MSFEEQQMMVNWTFEGVHREDNLTLDIDSCQGKSVWQSVINLTFEEGKQI